MQKTGIEYLDNTWNPIAMRCTPCSPGCKNCWHLRTADRLCRNPKIPFDEAMALEGAGPFVLRERELEAPLRLQKPAVIGVQFMGDLYHEDMPFDFIHEIYDRMKAAHQHTYLVLTKRHERMARDVNHIFALERMAYAKGWFNHIWHGLTICNQDETEKLRDLFNVPGERFVSMEPMLGPVEIPWLAYCLIHAVILGGETSPGARPLHPDWVRSVRDQCQAAGVPFFFKQWGEWVPAFMVEDEMKYDRQTVDGTIMCRVGHKRAGRLLDGQEHNELPWRKA